MKITAKQELAARCAYLGAVARFYGSNLHLDFRGGTWPTTDDDLDLSAHLADLLRREGYEFGKVVAKNYALSRPVVNTHPSSYDLPESEYRAQRKTL